MPDLVKGISGMSVMDIPQIGDQFIHRIGSKTTISSESLNQMISMRPGIPPKVALDINDEVWGELKIKVHKFPFSPIPHHSQGQV